MNENKPSNLFELLILIQKRPELYIGEKTLTCLSNNINGYNLSSFINNTEKENKNIWEEFNDFVAEKVGYFESTSGYKNMILEKNEFDETKSLNMFFELLEQFKIKI